MSLLDIFKKKKTEPMKKFSCDKAKWQFDSCLEEYCKVNKKQDTEISEEEFIIIQEMSSLHISYFLTWLIKNNYYVILDGQQNECEQVKTEKMKTTEFFRKNNDSVLTREDIKEEIIDFVDYYYETKYPADYENFMKNNGKNIFCSLFNWLDYYEIEKR